MMCLFHPLFHLFQHLSHLSTAIHEIFASNAKRFPNRQCVIETKSPRTAERTFTYRQINESSNQLAHHFLAHGCEVGDVVMIYAYRGSVLPLLPLSRH
jgi:L-aminoadipate-semialdehyde dehydrogenase